MYDGNSIGYKGLDPALVHAGVNGGAGMGPSYVPGWGLYCKLMHEAEAKKAAVAPEGDSAFVKAGDISGKVAVKEISVPQNVGAACQL